MDKPIVVVLCFSFIILVSGSSSPLVNPNANSFKTSIYTVISSPSNNYAKDTWYYFDIAFSSAFSTTSLLGLAAIADVFISLNVNTNVLIFTGMSSVNATNIKIRVYGSLPYFAKYKVSTLAFLDSFNGTNMQFNMVGTWPLINISSSGSY